MCRLCVAFRCLQARLPVALVMSAALNVTNSVRWGNPSTGFSTAAGNTFGQIGGPTGGQRSLRFGARVTF